MKYVLFTLMMISVSAFAADEISASSQLSTHEAFDSLTALSGSCTETVACPDGVHTATCTATGSHTKCFKHGAYGVKCVAWTNSGKSTSASQHCP